MNRSLLLSVFVSCAGLSACMGENRSDNFREQPTVPLNPPPMTAPVDPPASNTPNQGSTSNGSTTHDGSTTPNPLPPATTHATPSGDFGLVSHQPEDGSLHRSLSTTILLRFNRPLLQSTITPEAIRWLNRSTQAPIPFTARYDDSSHELSLSAREPLSSNTAYQITVSESLLSESSELLSPRTFQFTTAGHLGNTPQSIIDRCMTDTDLAILDLVNRYRSDPQSCGNSSQAAVAPLRWSCELAEAAANHSQDMATQGYFDHTSADGTTMSGRVNRTGYRYQRLGENIALGQRSPESVMQSWMNSPGHCRNIMNPNFTEIGHGMAVNAQGRRYWTQNFAAPR